MIEITKKCSENKYQLRKYSWTTNSITRKKLKDSKKKSQNYKKTPKKKEKNSSPVRSYLAYLSNVLISIGLYFVGSS